MRRKGGFTLIELLVVVLILGVLAATAMPLYNTWQQRAYGSEAIIMMKQLVEGQIMYLLEHEKYFPEAGGNYVVFKEGDGDPATAVSDINNALNVGITTKNRFKYTIGYNPADGSCTMLIEADFPLFKDGYKYLLILLNKEGRVDYLSREEVIINLFG